MGKDLPQWTCAVLLGSPADNLMDALSETGNIIVEQTATDEEFIRTMMTAGSLEKHVILLVQDDLGFRAKMRMLLALALGARKLIIISRAPTFLQLTGHDEMEKVAAFFTEIPTARAYIGADDLPGVIQAYNTVKEQVMPSPLPAPSTVPKNVAAILSPYRYPGCDGFYNTLCSQQRIGGIVLQQMMFQDSESPSLFYNSNLFVSEEEKLGARLMKEALFGDSTA